MNKDTSSATDPNSLAEALARPSAWDLTPDELRQVLHLHQADLGQPDVRALVSDCPPTNLEKYLQSALGELEIARAQQQPTFSGEAVKLSLS